MIILQATGDSWIDVLSPLGVAIPLVLILIFQLKECREERLATQKLFNEMLVKQSDTHADMVKSNNEAMTAMSRAITDVITSVRDLTREIQQDRREMLDAVHELHDDTLAIFREMKRGGD
jgi:hypothetical protein